MVGPNSGSATFGTLLRELRQSQNHTVDQGAALVTRAAGAPVTGAQVRAWENDTSAPSAADLGHLAVALEIPPLLLETALTRQRTTAARMSTSVNSADDYGVGHRVRQIRHWRGKSLAAVAGLAGISVAYLSNIENGYRAVTKRSLLEALAQALAVSPADLTDKPWEHGVSGQDKQAQPAFVAVADALDTYELGEDPGVPHRDWPDVAAAVHRLLDLAYTHANFAAAADLIPSLLGDLHAAYVRNPQQRAQVLPRLILCYRAASTVTQLLSGRSDGYTVVAAKLAQQCAAELESPQWTGITALVRALSGIPNRKRQYQRAVRAADELVPALDNAEARQAYGMLHLSTTRSALSGGRTSAAPT